MTDTPRDPHMDELPPELADRERPFPISGIDEDGEVVTGVIWPDHIAGARADVRRLHEDDD